MNVVFTQILVILLYVLIGFAAGKVGLIDPEQRKYLTRICTNLIMPFTVLSAASQAISGRDLTNLLMAAALFLAVYCLTTALSLAALRALRTPEPVRVTATSLVTYPNASFLGLPLCRALFGEMAVLYSTISLVVFNVLFFSWQYTMFTGRRFSIRNLITPPMVATVLLIPMLLLGWRFPAPAETVVGATGAMITPLSLIIIGVMMSENRLSAILRERRAYVVTAFRNFAIPLVVLLLLRLLPMDPEVRLCLLVLFSCPCAALTSIYAIQNDMEPELAARSVLMSTLCFAVSLPVILFLGMRVLG